ncbi:asparagine synthase (glutamine-hydrolyzing) [bacterium SCSIO 12741]|nr:asparagine synthase (glutamine-hydrolyzing) [bacterium SCSIO 12741]
MCGISGIYGLDGADFSAQLKRMTDVQAHRGPDASGMYTDDAVALGHNRLSIIDLDERANQPMISDDGNWVIVFNGEVYNYAEIKKLLPDYPFKTDSDTEVVLAAWKTWGEHCVHQFNGMFAFAIWNKANQELFLVRDRLGIKPLYVHVGDQVVFGSEVRTLLASGLVPRKLSRSYLAEYLKYQTVHAPRTLVEGVTLVPPGHYLKLAEGEMEEKQYWSLSERAERFTGDKAKAEQTIREKFVQSVERRLISDVPLGAFLSGGIDSSLITGVVSGELGKKISTFSVTFNEEEFSEAPFARQVAKKFGTDHHEIKLTPEDFLQEIPAALSAMDHPSGDGPNSYVVSKVTREKGITVALSGLGGDELFAGYPFFTRYLQLQDKKWMLSFPRGFRSIAGQALRKLKPGVSSDKIAELLNQGYLDLAHAYPVNRRVMADKDIRSLLGSSTVPADPLALEIDGFFAFGQAGSRLPDLSKVSVTEISTYMQNVLLRDTDQMAMASALEVRVPFLDHQLVEWVLGVPDSIKYPHSPKKLLIDSFAGLLPDEIVNRPKMGFVLPWQNWLKKELLPVAEESLGYLKEVNALNGAALDQLLQRFLNDDPSITWSRIWPLVSLGFWLKNNELE